MWMIFDDVVHLPIDPAVDGVDDAVALSACRILKEGGRKEPLAIRHEDDVNRIVHSAGHHRLDP